MNVETVEDLANQLADWFGIYGGCKNVCHDDDKCDYDAKKPFCCRFAFTADMEERIRTSVENENKLTEIGLT